MDNEEKATSLDNDGKYVCDSCGEEIVIPLDPMGGHNQEYVEDCPVCCNPNLIHVQWDDDQVRVWAEPEQDPH
ncbi:MAG: CPXCG motif-containing cysteine-rich protein [Pirellulaceae bacterium]|nr:CPXCG motif-containing cysteine-rich protein [Pirellulaceae bacterium]